MDLSIKGPFVPTVVNTQSEFEEIFGTPDGSYYTGYTVQNYLRETGTVTIVRIGNIGGYTELASSAIRNKWFIKWRKNCYNTFPNS